MGVVEQNVVNEVGGVDFAEKMSSRAGHVDVNERRLRPIYGEDSLNC